MNAKENISFPNFDNLHPNNKHLLNIFFGGEGHINSRLVAFSNTNHPKYLVLHVINIVSLFMKFTISATHPMYQHCKVTPSLAMFQGLPMLSKKQVESSQSKKLQ